MMIRTGLVFCLMAVLLTSGCVTTREDRVNTLKSTYPQWDQSTIEKVIDRQVEIGMTEEMVRAMRKPGSTRKEGDVTIWEYSRMRKDNMGIYQPTTFFYVHFRNGRVIDIQGDKSVMTDW